MSDRGSQRAGVYTLGVIGTGVAALLFSFLPYYGVSYKFGPGVLGGSSNTNAWHGTALLGLLLVLAAAALVAAKVFGNVALPELPVGWGFVVLAISALGTLLIVVRSLTLPTYSGVVDVGLKFGAYLLILAALAQTVSAFLAMRASGEPLPWASRHGPPAPQPPAA